MGIHKKPLTLLVKDKFFTNAHNQNIYSSLNITVFKQNYTFVLHLTLFKNRQ